MPVNRPNRHGSALDRRGVALPLALLGLVLISLLVTAALLSSSTQFAMSNAQQEGTAGLYASDAALESFVNAKAVLGTATALERGSEPHQFNNVTWTMHVSRLSQRGTGANPDNAEQNRVEETYSIVAEPPQNRGRRVGALVTATRDYNRFDTNINSGASVSSDKIKLPGGSATLSGIDTSSCATGDVAGLTLAAGVDASQVNRNQVEGRIDTTTITKANFAAHLLDGLSPEQFAKIANIKWGVPALVGAKPHPTYTFDTNAFDHTRASGLNWGCPIGLASPDPCLNDDDKNYMPVVAVQPPTGTQAQFKGVGQGVLIVLGNARFNAGFIFKGIVIVVGELTVNGGTNVYGAMVALGDVTLEDQTAADADGEQATFNGQSLVKFDRCQLNNAIDAINKAMAGSAPQTFNGTTHAWFEVVR